MPSNTENRIVHAIKSLIDHIVPRDPTVNDRDTAERRKAYFDLAKGHLEHAPNPATCDYNNASDLIKRSLVQADPSRALEFNNAYSRLLSVRVLNQKWAILHLLYELADSPDPDEPISPTEFPQQSPSIHGSERRYDRDSGPGTPLQRVEEEISENASRSPSPRPSPMEGGRRTQEDVDGKGKQRGQMSRAAFESEPNPHESELLRDLPFTLQGLSSTTLPFVEPGKIHLPATLPIPITSLLHTLAEPSLLYRKLDVFVKSPAKGLLSQSLRAAIGLHLRKYLKLVAALEAHVRKALSCLDKTQPRGGLGKTGVTLKTCVISMRKTTRALRLLTLVAEESESRRGGQLISLIHSFATSHGDETVSQLSEQLLTGFTHPFYDILRHWIYDGELSDPYLEFFVRQRMDKDDVGDKNPGGNSVWEDKFKVDEAMIPSIMTHDFVQKVFLIGKSLNFIRHSCGDSQWVEKYSRAESEELSYGDLASLEENIDKAYKITMSRLIELMANKFNLFEHLQALKRYILLGQGDFIALLMESLAANLDRPAGAQYRHTLTAQLDHAIRGSNAQYDSSEVLRRLDARMLQLSHGDIGWDCFTLEYKIDAPVDVVVTEWGNRQYLKVFNFLWRIKRVEFALSSTWRKCMTGSRGVLQSPDSTVEAAWKSTRGVLAEMIHFVGQLQYYILFEVIESSWEELQKRIHAENCTLDDIIKAHTRYLNDITHKGLLGPRKSRYQQALSQETSSGEDDRTSYLAQLGELLRTMLSYRDSVDGLYSWSVSDFTSRQEADVRISTRVGRGDSGEDKPGLDPKAGPVTSEFPVLMDRLKHLSTSFRNRLQILLGDLAYQPDVDMRFLGVAMNFNDVYHLARRRTKTPQTAGSVVKQ